MSDEPINLYGVGAVARSKWGAMPPAKQRTPVALNEYSYIELHHGATPDRATVERSPAAVMRSYQRTHINDNNWSDLFYCAGLAPNGVLYDGRSYYRSHKGKWGDAFTVVMLGTHDTADITPEQWATIKRLLKGHREATNHSFARLSWHNERAKAEGKWFSECPGRRGIQQLTEYRDTTDWVRHPDGRTTTSPTTSSKLTIEEATTYWQTHISLPDNDIDGQFGNDTLTASLNRDTDLIAARIIAEDDLTAARAEIEERDTTLETQLEDIAKLIGQRDDAEKLAYAARTERGTAIAERDQALAAMAQARVERGNAYTQRNQAIAHRDAAYQERDEARDQLAQAIAERDEALQGLVTARTDQEVSRNKVFEFTADLVRIRAERDKLKADLTTSLETYGDMEAELSEAEDELCECRDENSTLTAQLAAANEKIQTIRDIPVNANTVQTVVRLTEAFKIINDTIESETTE